MDGMVEVKIGAQWQVPHFGMRQHGGVLAGTIVADGSRLEAVLDESPENLRIARHVRAAFEEAFIEPRFGQDRFRYADVFVTALVRGAGQGQFPLGQSEMLRTTMFDEGQNLKRLGAGA